MTSNPSTSSASSSPSGPRSRRIASAIVKGIIPLAVSAGLVAWLFHKIDLAQLKAVISRGIDYRFIAAMMALTILSYVIRGIRWGIQLRAAGIPRIPVMAESVSIFSAYALNLLFPFLGEAWRCIYISRRERCKLSTVVGTDLADRASDAVMILLLIILALVVARPALTRFADHYTIGHEIIAALTSARLWIIVGLVIAAAVAVTGIFRGRPWVAALQRSVGRAWRGFAVIFHMKGTGLYIVLTFGIWICYFLETYCVFFAFPFTRDILITPALAYGLLPGLVVFVFGSCSMGIPSNGGLGPWNVAVMFALSLYGISDTDGAAFSLIFWSFQAMIIIAAGIFSAFYIISSRRRMTSSSAGARNLQAPGLVDKV